MVSAVIGIPGPPNTEVLVTFNESMDTGVVPATGSFTLMVDAAPRTPGSVSWSGPAELRLLYAGIAPIVSGIVSLDVVDLNLRNTAQTVAVPIQSVPFFP